MASSLESSPISTALTWLVRGVAILALGAIAVAILRPSWLSGQLAANGDKPTQASESTDATEQDQSIPGFDPMLPDIDDPDTESPIVVSTLQEDDQNADDRGGEIKSPLVEGVANLLGQVASATGSEELDLTDMLSEADRELTRTKLRNQLAMREANRRFRRVSPGDKHLVLVTVEGLRQSDLKEVSSDLKYLPAMSRASLHFTQFYSRQDSDLAWQAFHRSRNDVSRARSQTTQTRFVLNSGYQTALIGDCSHAPVFAGVEDDNYDFRFGLESWGDRRATNPKTVWSNGVELKILNPRAQSRESVEELCVREAADFIFRERGQRPFFLHVALKLADDDLSPGQSSDRIDELMRLDRQLERLLRATHAADIESKTVFIVAGIGSKSTSDVWSNASAVPVPLMFYWPGRSAEGKRVELPCGVMDLLPTITDWADAKSVTQTEGLSLAPSRLAELANNERVIMWREEDMDSVICQNPWTLIAGSSPWLLRANSGDEGLVFESTADDAVLLDGNLAEEHPEITRQLMQAVK